MSFAKSDLKILTYNDVGNRLDDMLEAAQRSKSSLEGGKQALFAAAKNVEALLKASEQDLEEGRLPDVETLGHVKKALVRALTSVQTLAKNFENREIMAAGSVDMASKSVALVKKLMDDEKRKLSGLVEAAELGKEEESNGRERPAGLRPGPSIAQQRRAEGEELKEKSAKKTRKKRGKNAGQNTGG